MTDMTGLESALYARSNLAWAAMFDGEAEDAMAAGSGDAAGALAGGLECRRLAAEAQQRVAAGDDSQSVV